MDNCDRRDAEFYALLASLGKCFGIAMKEIRLHGDCHLF